LRTEGEDGGGGERYERYQHNRNWVPDARESLFAVVVLLIAGGEGENREFLERKERRQLLL